MKRTPKKLSGEGMNEGDGKLNISMFHLLAAGFLNKRQTATLTFLPTLNYHRTETFSGSCSTYERDLLLQLLTFTQKTNEAL